MIRSYALKHGWYYFYRFNYERCRILNGGLTSLKNFLENIGENCPNDYFNKGPRSSALTFRLKDLKLYSVKGHEINTLASEALKDVDSRNAHNAIELFFLEYDQKTLAAEVPLWLKYHEFASFIDLFKTKLPLTGHVDLLRLEDEKIWIWDYKPSASQELYASTQVFFYAYMLSRRTGIPIENIRCGYFDTNHSYMFNPADVSIIRDNTLAAFIE